MGAALAFSYTGFLQRSVFGREGYIGHANRDFILYFPAILFVWDEQEDNSLSQ